MVEAIADFRCKVTSTTVLKKSAGIPEIICEPTPDLLAYLGAIRKSSQILVDFASETSEPEIEGKRELKEKR